MHASPAHHSPKVFSSISQSLWGWDGSSQPFYPKPEAICAWWNIALHKMRKIEKKNFHPFTWVITKPGQALKVETLAIVATALFQNCFFRLSASGCYISSCLIWQIALITWFAKKSVKKFYEKSKYMTLSKLWWLIMTFEENLQLAI